MDVSEDKEGDEGGIERDSERKREESSKRNAVQHEEDSGTNSASIVYVAWLTF